MEGCSRNSFPKQRSCLSCISYQNGFCRRRRQLCGEDADCSFKKRLLIQAHVKERNVVVPQFDVVFTQQHRMRRDGCGPHADVISQSGLLRHAI